MADRHRPKPPAYHATTREVRRFLKETFETLSPEAPENEINHWVREFSGDGIWLYGRHKEEWISRYHSHGESIYDELQDSFYGQVCLHFRLYLSSVLQSLPFVLPLSSFAASLKLIVLKFRVGVCGRFLTSLRGWSAVSDSISAGPNTQSDHSTQSFSLPPITLPESLYSYATSIGHPMYSPATGCPNTSKCAGVGLRQRNPVGPVGGGPRDLVAPSSDFAGLRGSSPSYSSSC